MTKARFLKTSPENDKLFDWENKVPGQSNSQESVDCLSGICAGGRQSRQSRTVGQQNEGRFFSFLPWLSNCGNQLKSVCTSTLSTNIDQYHPLSLVKLNLILPPDGCCNVTNMYLQLTCHLVECVNPMRVCNLLLSDDRSKSASHACDNFYHTFLTFLPPVCETWMWRCTLQLKQRSTS